MRASRRAAAALAIGLLTGLGTYAVATTPVRLVPGGRLWVRCVGGASPEGTLGASTTVFVPGLDRGRPLRLLVASEGGSGNLGVSADRRELEWVRVSPAGAVLTIPPTFVPGLHLTLRTEAAGGLRLRSIDVQSDARPWASALLAGIGGAAAAAAFPWAAMPAVSLALALLAGGLLTLAASPLVLFWSLPAAAAILRVLVPFGLVVAGLAIGIRAADTRRFAFGAGLVGAAVFGVWVRGYFLPSAGSWDVDYWKACALRTTSHGVTRAYGDPDAVPPGHFIAQMRGLEPAWELPAFGRTFVIDQPPGIMLLWKSSWWLMSHLPLGLTHDEALNVAAKLPPVLGDVFAVGVLLWAFGGTTRRALALAALYWALPISWLPGAVLGFFDGAYVPLALAALVMAGRGRAASAGALLAAAALVKSLALLMAPAVAIALWNVRAPIRRGLTAGLAVAAAALVPFVLDGTLPTAAVHMYRILFQLRLSGGYANAWWILSHLLSLDTRAATDAIPYVRIEVVPFPVRPLGTLLFLCVAGWVARCQLRAAGPRTAALAAAVLVLAYGQLAIGIHENHPHAFAPALVATGLLTTRLRILAGVFFTTYVLNMLALSGLGRFYGTRYVAIDGLARAAASVRLGFGFDLTLALAAINIAAFTWLLVVLRREMLAASGGQDT
jgi:hypothetical protein